MAYNLRADKFSLVSRRMRVSLESASLIVVLQLFGFLRNFNRYSVSRRMNGSIFGCSIVD